MGMDHTGLAGREMAKMMEIDIRNQLIFSLILTIPIVMYSPLGARHHPAEIPIGAAFDARFADSVADDLLFRMFDEMGDAQSLRLDAAVWVSKVRPETLSDVLIADGRRLPADVRLAVAVHRAARENAGQGDHGGAGGHSGLVRRAAGVRIDAAGHHAR